MDVIDAPTGDRDGLEEDEEEYKPPSLSAHQSRPGRTVITEDGNSEAWIATDLTIEEWR
jgi:hypothetical protein